jgi:hypothetical protein
MNEPAGQHPKRAVLDPKALNALLDPVKDSHVPPHNVRVKPLLKNAVVGGEKRIKKLGLRKQKT